jgi:hypothetical protein
MMASFGQSYTNCGYTFDVPAGTYNLNINQAGTTGSPMISAANTTFNPNTYYLIAVMGDPNQPQLAISSTNVGAVASQNGSSGAGTNASGTGANGTNGSGTGANGSGSGSGTGSGSGSGSGSGASATAAPTAEATSSP